MCVALLDLVVDSPAQDLSALTAVASRGPDEGGAEGAVEGAVDEDASTATDADGSTDGVAVAPSTSALPEAVGDELHAPSSRTTATRIVGLGMDSPYPLRGSTPLRASSTTLDVPAARSDGLGRNARATSGRDCSLEPSAKRLGLERVWAVRSLTQSKSFQAQPSAAPS